MGLSSLGLGALGSLFSKKKSQSAPAQPALTGDPFQDAINRGDYSGAAAIVAKDLREANAPGIARAEGLGYDLVRRSFLARGLSNTGLETGGLMKFADERAQRAAAFAAGNQAQSYQMIAPFLQNAQGYAENARQREYEAQQRKKDRQTALWGDLGGMLGTFASLGMGGGKGGGGGGATYSSSPTHF